MSALRIACLTELLAALCRTAVCATLCPHAQNNLFEYYTMISWVRPGFMGSTAEFEQDFVQPIDAGVYARGGGGA